jgi:hypothetical protein
VALTPAFQYGSTEFAIGSKYETYRSSIFGISQGVVCLVPTSPEQATNAGHHRLFPLSQVNEIAYPGLSGLVISCPHRRTNLPKTQLTLASTVAYATGTHGSRNSSWSIDMWTSLQEGECLLASLTGAFSARYQTHSSLVPRLAAVTLVNAKLRCKLLKVDVPSDWMVGTYLDFCAPVVLSVMVTYPSSAL